VFFVKNIKESKKIEGLQELILDTQQDNRGQIWPLHSKCDFLPDFVEDKISISTKNVLRGLHGDADTSKLITCLYGKIQLAVIDLRKRSKTYLNCQTFILDEKTPRSIFVPKGCVNGHLCLSEKCIFYYKWSKKYSGAENQITIKYNDKSANIEWLTDNPILSDRDRAGIKLEGVYL
jgi:dTDP-4-dehydrorhamnose 3,5-epimerase